MGEVTRWQPDEGVVANDREEARDAATDWPPTREELERPSRGEAEADDRYMRGDR